MKNIKRIITFVMVLTLILTAKIAPDNLNNVYASTFEDLIDSEIVMTVPIFVEKSENRIEEETGNNIEKAYDDVNYSKIGMWHAEDYWSHGPGTEGRIYDSEVLLLDDGVTIDLNTAFGYTVSSYQRKIEKGTPLAKALDEGKQIYINLANARSTDVPLDTKFDLGMDDEGNFLENPDGSLRDVYANVFKNSVGDYTIVLFLPTKLNFYTFTELNYFEHYGVKLKTYIPFIQYGYGTHIYSVNGKNLKELGVSGGMLDANEPMTQFTPNSLHPKYVSSGEIAPDGRLKGGYIQDGILLDGDSSNSGKTDTFDVLTDGFTIGTDGWWDGTSAMGLSFTYEVGMNVYTVETPDLGIEDVIYDKNKSEFTVKGRLTGRDLNTDEQPVVLRLSWETEGGETGDEYVVSDKLVKDGTHNFVVKPEFTSSNPVGTFRAEINPYDYPKEVNRLNNVFEGEFGDALGVVDDTETDIVDFDIYAPFTTTPIINDGSKSNVEFKVYVALDNSEDAESTVVGLYKADGTLVNTRNITIDGGDTLTLDYSLPLSGMSEGANNYRVAVNTDFGRKS